MKRTLKSITNFFWLLIHPKEIEHLKHCYVSLDGLPVPYFEADKRGQITYANKKALEEFGYEVVENINILEAVVPEERSSVTAAFRNIQRGESPVLGVRRRMLRADKSTFLGTLFLSSNNGSIRGVIIDLSKQEALEKELRESNESKDQLFSIISHDLRSPVGNSMALIGLLCDNYDEDQSAQKKLAQGAYQGAARAFALTENLLSWAQLHIRSSALELVPLSLENEVTNVISSVMYQAETKNITLKSYVFGVEVVSNSTVLQVILRNLITNAIKFTNPNGKIDVIALPQKNFVEVFVSDNGLGMSQEQQNKLFSLDEYSSAVGTSGEKGTGLGLILCKESIKKLGGTLSVESTVGKGSKFIFTLPLS